MSEEGAVGEWGCVRGRDDAGSSYDGAGAQDGWET